MNGKELGLIYLQSEVKGGESQSPKKYG